MWWGKALGEGIEALLENSCLSFPSTQVRTPRVTQGSDLGVSQPAGTVQSSVPATRRGDTGHVERGHWKPGEGHIGHVERGHWEPGEGTLGTWHSPGHSGAEAQGGLGPPRRARLRGAVPGLSQSLQIPLGIHCSGVHCATGTPQRGFYGDAETPSPSRMHPKAWKSAPSAWDSLNPNPGIFL